MKPQLYLYLALTAHFVATLKVPFGTQKLERRQGIAGAAVIAMNAPYGKVQTLNKMATRVELPPRYSSVKGFKTVKIRYGPYKVPNMGVTTRTLTGNEEGMLWNYPDTNIQKPCSDCMVVGIVPDYEDLSGKSVNINNGHWLHHILMISSNKRGDPTCKGRATSLPHMVVGFNAATSERFFASGNERSSFRLFDKNITDAGYRISKGDNWAMVVDLMNMNREDNTLYVAITYDYIEGKPESMSEIKPVWLDVDQCGFSEVRPRTQNGAYTVNSTPWRANVDGELVVIGGHVHDGGTRAVIKADGKVVCDSKAGYGENAMYISPGGDATAPKGKSDGGHNHSEGRKPHISSMVLCWRGRGELKVPQIRTGQMWTIEAQYDYTKFAGATHKNGLQENVMGIAVVWVKQGK